MQVATCSTTVRRTLLATVAFTALVVLPGAAGSSWRGSLPLLAAAAAWSAIFVAKTSQGAWRIGRPLLALLIPASLATAFAVDLPASLWGGPYGGGLTTTLGLIGLAWAVALQADDAVPALRLLLAGILPAVSGFVVLQRCGLDPLAERGFGPEGAWRGAFSDPVACGGFLALAGAFVFGGAFDAREGATRRRLFAAAPAVAGVGIFATGTRAPFLALGAGVWAATLLAALVDRRPGRAKLLAGAAIFVLVPALSAVRGDPERPSFLLSVVSEAGAARDGLHAGAARALNLADGLRFALGHGLESAGATATFRRPDPGLATDELDPRYVRLKSLLHEKLLTEGWVGLVGFTLFLTYLLLMGALNRRTPRYGPFAVVAAYLVWRMTHAAAPEVELLFAVAAGFLLRPRGDAPVADLGAAGALRFDARTIAGLSACALLTGVGLAATLAPSTFVAAATGLFVLALLGRPEPLRVAAAGAAVVAALFWREPLERAARRDAARPTFAGADAPSAAAAYRRYAAEPGARAWELVAAAALADADGAADEARALRRRASAVAPADRSLRAWAAGLGPGAERAPSTVEEATVAVEALPWEADGWRRLIALRREAGDAAGAEDAAARFRRVVAAASAYGDRRHAARLAAAAEEYPEPPSAAAPAAAAASRPK